MKSARSLISWAFVAAAALVPAALAQTAYPHQPLKFVIPFSAGSSTDTFARAAAKHISGQFGQPIVVENVPGAQGQIAAAKVARSEADGYTVFVTSSTTHAANASMYKKLSYDPVADFEPVAKLATLSLAMIIHPSIPATNLQEFIAYAKANPGKLTAGTTGAVGTDTFHMYQLQAAAGVKFKLVPFDSATDVSAALTSGQIDVVFSDTSWVRLGGGKMTAVAVAAADPHPDFPDIPTYKQSNLDIVGVRLRAPAAPPKTPATVVKYWEDICKKATEDPKLKEELGKIGQPVQFLSAAETTALVNQMATDIEKIVSEQGLAK